MGGAGIAQTRYELEVPGFELGRKKTYSLFHKHVNRPWASNNTIL